MTTPSSSDWRGLKNKKHFGLEKLLNVNETREERTDATHSGNLGSEKCCGYRGIEGSGETRSAAS
jgi:hypothetical protein